MQGYWPKPIRSVVKYDVGRSAGRLQHGISRLLPIFSKKNVGSITLDFDRLMLLFYVMPQNWLGVPTESK